MSEHEQARTPWRDNLEALAMAVVMALLLKVFVIEAYKIPTGSMQPTLIGDEDAGIHDRILVDKLSYAFRDPLRWEVVVFRYPLERSKNFVKRIVGVGPEEIRVHRGDLWRRDDPTQEWQVLRRPASVQRSAWKRLDVDEPEQSNWRVTPDGAAWEVETRTIRARGDGRAGYRAGEGALLDHYLDGYPEDVASRLTGPHVESGMNPVGDVRFEAQVDALAGLARVAVVLTEGVNTYRLVLPGPDAPPEERARIEWKRQRNGRVEALDRREPANEDLRLVAGERAHLAAYNLDDRVVLELDGEVVVELEVDSTEDQRSAVAFEVAGEGADLTELMVSRDIYYTASGAKTAQTAVPAGHYFVLGDNTQDSSDSREWIFARYEFRGDSEDPTDRTLVRGGFRRGENPLHVGAGSLEGPRLRLIDEWGEDHWFRAGDAFQLEPETSPFVPRELVLGRALAVFWPLSPPTRIHRLQWVR